MLIGVIFMSLLGQALSCVFIFYCLDRKFIDMGYPAPNNVPHQMKKLFGDIKGSSSSPNNTYNDNTFNNGYNNHGYGNNNGW